MTDNSKLKFRQHKLMDCGCACVAGILKYNKIVFSYDLIIERTKYRIGGTNFENLQQCLHSFNLQSETYECRIEDIIKKK